MDQNKSLDNHQVIAALLSDVQTLHSEVYTPRAMRLDYRKMSKRLTREGISFLTKALPRLGKAFDRALTGEVSFDSTGFCKESDTQLPKFLGGLFERVFSHDGWVLRTPCVKCIDTIRQVLGLYYKLKLPYTQEDENRVLEKFERTEQELADINQRLSHLASSVDWTDTTNRKSFDFGKYGSVIAKARVKLNKLFSHFDQRDIVPSHGPGSVSTRERLWEKWVFRTISPRISSTYPLDAYFYASPGHVCDSLQEISNLKIQESSARVLLVPKDSRGPRLISCEPLDFQWIQQGLSRAIVRHVESHPLTRWNVNFTKQQPNQFGALLGSKYGKYATLDLNEASDRVSVGLVQLLFPEPLLEALLNCRSLSTELPDGRVMVLNKYAPMGSALCFPVLALTIWALLSSAAPDAYTRKRILVYGDDVIVPTDYSENAMELLESFGLKINRDKSCTKGFFRESCGVDAFAGVNVTPVRFRTVWSSHRCPHVYASYISYANALYRKRFFNLYQLLADKLLAIFGPIPSRAIYPDGFALVDVPDNILARIPVRTNSRLQRRERYVWEVRSVPIKREIEGWRMLLRFFTEGHRHSSHDRELLSRRCDTIMEDIMSPFSVRSYTKRKQVKLVKRWR